MGVFIATITLGDINTTAIGAYFKAVSCDFGILIAIAHPHTVEVGIGRGCAEGVIAHLEVVLVFEAQEHEVLAGELVVFYDRVELPVAKRSTVAIVVEAIGTTCEAAVAEGVVVGILPVASLAVIEDKRHVGAGAVDGFTCHDEALKEVVRGAVLQVDRTLIAAVEGLDGQLAEGIVIRIVEQHEPVIAGAHAVLEHNGSGITVFCLEEDAVIGISTQYIVEGHLLVVGTRLHIEGHRTKDATVAERSCRITEAQEVGTIGTNRILTLDCRVDIVCCLAVIAWVDVHIAIWRSRAHADVMPYRFHESVITKDKAGRLARCE